MSMVSATAGDETPWRTTVEIACVLVLELRSDDAWDLLCERNDARFASALDRLLSPRAQQQVAKALAKLSAWRRQRLAPFVEALAELLAADLLRSNSRK